jgi:hypothetical protein
MKRIKVRSSVLELHFRNMSSVVPPKADPWSVALKAWGIGHGAVENDEYRTKNFELLSGCQNFFIQNSLFEISYF